MDDNIEQMINNKDFILINKIEDIDMLSSDEDIFIITDTEYEEDTNSE
jgi:hypothetical protein